MSTQRRINDPENSWRQLEDHSLEERRIFLQALFDSSFDAVLVTNNEGRYIDANFAACDLLGYTREELLQLSVPDLTAEPFRDDALAMWQQFLATGSASGEYFTRHKDGTVLQLEFRALANVLPGVHVSSSRDLKERSRAEEKTIAEESLRQSQSLLAEAQHFAHLGSWSRNLITNEVAWSDELFRLFGLEPQQEGSNYEAFLARVHPHDRLRTQAIAQEAIQTLESRACEYRIVREDGVERILRERIFVTANNQGQAIRIFGTTQDITERRESEQALRESEERYRELFENAKDGFYVHDLNGRYTDVNRAAEKLTGYSREEILGRTFLDFVPPEQVNLINEHFCKKLVQEGETAYETEVVTREGSRVAVEVSSHLIYEEKSGVAVQGTFRDITERKLLDEKLRESEEKYRTILERMEEGYAEVDLRGTYVFVNDSFCRITGRSQSELLGVNYKEIFDREQSQLLYATYHNVYLTGEPVQEFEYVVTRKDGTKRLVEESVSLKRDADGQPVGFTGIRRDVTERKQAEEALRQAEENYRTIFENSVEGVFRTTADGRFITANPAMARMLGFSSPEELIRGHDGVKPNYLAPERSEEFKRSLEEHGFVRGFEYKGSRQDGSNIWLSDSVRAVRDESGTLLYYEGIAEDITERKLAEERLREYEKVVEGLEEMIVVVDRDYRCLIANRALLAHRGLSREDLVGHSLRELFSAEQFEKVIRKKLDECFQGNVVKYEIGFNDPNTGARDLFISYFPIESAAGVDRVACVIQDITERKLAEATLRNYSRLLIEAQESERQRIARELHDQVGQMLTAIKINMQMVGDPNCKKDSSSLIEQGVGLIDTALEEVRNLSFELRPSLLDNLGLPAALRWHCNQFTQRTGIQAKSTTNLLAGEARLSPELEITCFRIVQEAMTNVARHAKAEHVSIDLIDSQHEVRLAITDDGRGFADPSPSRDAAAHSLGLMGIKERALALGGRLEIRSTPDQGTEIRVSFPAVRSHEHNR